MDTLAGSFRPGGVKCRAAFFDKRDLAVLVDHKCGAIREAPLRDENGVLRCYFSGEITGKWEREMKMLVGPVLEGRKIIDANADYLRVSTFEIGDTTLVRRQFLRSTTGKRGWEKGDNYVLLASKFG